MMLSAVTVWMVILSYSVFSETSLGLSESCHSPSMVAGLLGTTEGILEVSSDDDYILGVADILLV